MDEMPPKYREVATAVHLRRIAQGLEMLLGGLYIVTGAARIDGIFNEDIVMSVFRALDSDAVQWDNEARVHASIGEYELYFVHSPGVTAAWVENREADDGV